MKLLIRAATPGYLAVLLLGIATSSGCERDATPETVEVFAASSLTESFQDLESAFEAARPGVDVRVTFAGSQVLRMQIEQGAAADLFASANPGHMEALVDSGQMNSPTTFATNRLCLIEPSKTDSPMRSFEDLRHARRLVVGDMNVPIGQYTAELLDRAEEKFGAEFAREVRSNIVSRESNVRLVRAKVELGEADAAIVYCTDAVASDRVKTSMVPTDIAVSVNYQIATRPDASAVATAFADFVSSEQGRAILLDRGFQPPD